MTKFTNGLKLGWAYLGAIAVLIGALAPVGAIFVAVTYETSWQRELYLGLKLAVKGKLDALGKAKLAGVLSALVGYSVLWEGIKQLSAGTPFEPFVMVAIGLHLVVWTCVEGVLLLREKT